MSDECTCGHPEVIDTKYGRMCIFCWRDFFDPRVIDA